MSEEVGTLNFSQDDQAEAISGHEVAKKRYLRQSIVYQLLRTNPNDFVEATVAKARILEAYIYE